MIVFKIIPKKINILRLFLINLAAAMFVLFMAILGVIGVVKGIHFIINSPLPTWVFQLGFFILLSIIVAIITTFSYLSIDIQKRLNNYLDK